MEQNNVINPADTHIPPGNSTLHSSITDGHKLYAFILPTLVALLQVQTAGNITSPSQVHPVTTEACVFGLLGYYLAFRASRLFTQHATKLSIAMAAFGSFSSASLVTLLLPHSWWHTRYIFYFLLVLIELHPLLTLLYDRCVRRMWSMISNCGPRCSALRNLITVTIAAISNVFFSNFLHRNAITTTIVTTTATAPATATIV